MDVIFILLLPSPLPAPHLPSLIWPMSNFAHAFNYRHKTISNKEAGLSLTHSYKKMLQAWKRKLTGTLVSTGTEMPS